MQFEAGWWWPKGNFGRLPLLTNVLVLAEFGVLGSGVATTTANGVAVNARRGCLSLESFVQSVLVQIRSSVMYACLRQG